MKEYVRVSVLHYVSVSEIITVNKIVLITAVRTENPDCYRDGVRLPRCQFRPHNYNGHFIFIADLIFFF